MEKCPAQPDLNGTRKAFADMLVFNVTLHRGAFHVLPRGNVLVKVGTGFQRTCDDAGVCMFDPTLPCIGGSGANGAGGLCARCLTKAEVARGRGLHPAIFVAYYGTDRHGKYLQSGNKNPINFRKYSLGGVYTILVGAKEKYIDGLIDYDWKSLIPNVTLSDLKLPDFGAIWEGVKNPFLGQDGAEGSEDE